MTKNLDDELFFVKKDLNVYVDFADSFENKSMNNMNGLNNLNNTFNEEKNKFNGGIRTKSLQLDLNDNLTDFNCEIFSKVERENIENNNNISFEGNGSEVNEVPKIHSPIVKFNLNFSLQIITIFHLTKTSLFVKRYLL